MCGHGGDAIKVLDTETTRVDVNCPQERACPNKNATAKAIMSGAPPTSGHTSDQEVFIFQLNILQKMQEQFLFIILTKPFILLFTVRTSKCISNLSWINFKVSKAVYILKIYKINWFHEILIGQYYLGALTNEFFSFFEKFYFAA